MKRTLGRDEVRKQDCIGPLDNNYFHEAGSSRQVYRQRRYDNSTTGTMEENP
jgi:hypothetical protein